MEISINKEDDPTGGPALAQCGPLNELEKDGKQMSPAEENAITEAVPLLDSEESSTLEAASGLKDIIACPQEKELENAEINLVIEVKTDAELGQDSVEQGEENSSGEHGKDAIVPEQVLTQMDSEDPERDSPGTASEVAHQQIEKKSSEITISNQKAKSVEREAKISIMQTDVVKQEFTAVISSDGMKDLESKGEDLHSVVEVQARADFERLHEEATLATTRGLDNKPLNVLDLASGPIQRLESPINEEEQRKSNVGESAEIIVEADSGIMPCRKRIVEEHVPELGLQTSELSGVVDIDRKKARMDVEDSVDLAQHGSALLERQTDMLTCTKAGEVNIVQCIEGSSGDHVRDITRDQGSGSIITQTEQKADRNNLEGEGVRSGSIQCSEGTDRVQNEIVEETTVLTVAEGDKDVIRELGTSHIIVREGTMGGKREPSCEKEAGTLEKTPDTESILSSGVMESGPGLGPKQRVTERKKCHQDDNGAADKHKMVTITEHIKVHSSKESFQVLQVGQEAQSKEAISDMIGQDTRAASIVPGVLQFSRSDSVTVEDSHTDGLHLERQQSQKVHTEMQMRLEAKRPREGFEGGSGRLLRDLPLSRHNEVKEEERCSSMGQHWRVGIVMKVKTKEDMPVEGKLERHKDTIVRDVLEEHQGWDFQGISRDNTLHQIARHGVEEERTGLSDEANTGTSEEDRIFGGQLERGGTIQKASQKRKLSDNVMSDSGAANEQGQNESVVKKAKKKAVNVWAKTTSRKGPKKNNKNGGPQNPSNENSVLLTPVYANPDKVEDGPDQPIALSKYDKAEKIELSEDRLSASSTKGYRMVRATRGVQEGTWYYEIVVEQLGPTGHTRLGWSTQKGDVQAPVGFDSNSYGYRDLDGSKTHVAIREPYGDLYVEGDVIGFYIHLPNGAEYASKPAPLLSYRGRPHLSDVKEEPPRRVPGSEICFFRNGVCQGTAFTDIYGGRYFPAASMYTLPKEPSCIVKFNFGPDFRCPPVDLDGRPSPTAMVHAPYHNAFGGKEVTPVAYANVSATGHGVQSMEPQMKIV